MAVGHSGPAIGKAIAQAQVAAIEAGLASG